MATVTCPQCREPLDVPDHMLGSPVRCAACGTAFNPPAPTTRDDPYDDRPRRRPKRGGMPGWVIALLGVMFVGVCGCCGGFTLVIVRMMNPDFKPFDAPDGTFAARFPDGPPDPATPPTGRGNGETGKGFEHTRTMVGVPMETYFAYTVELADKDRRRKPADVAEELAAGLVTTQAGAREITPKPRPRRAHGGHDGVDVLLHHKDGKHTQARAVVAHGRGFVFGVTGPGQPQGSPWVQEFLDGFEIKEPAGGAKPKPAKADEEEPAERPKAKPPAGPKRELAPRPRAGREDD